MTDEDLFMSMHEELDKPDEEVRSMLLAEFPGPRRPGGITAAEAAELWGISGAGARKRLRKLVRLGKMTREDAVIDEHRVSVWYARPTPESESGSDGLEEIKKYYQE